MEIFVSKDGKILGPMGEQEVLDKVERGEFTEQDLAMTEGLADWTPLGSIIVWDPALSPFRAAVHYSAEVAETSTKRLISIFADRPGTAGIVALLLGCVLILLCQWPFLIYGPFLLAAIAGAILLFRRGRRVRALLVLAITVILPGMLLVRIIYRQPAVSPIPAVASMTPPLPVASPSLTPSAIPGLSFPDRSSGNADSATPPSQSLPQPTAARTPPPAPPLAADTPNPPSINPGAAIVPPNDTVPRATPPPPPTVATNIASPAFNTPPAVQPTPAPQVDILSQVYLVDTEDGKGSGFLVRMAGGTYFVTNFHVLEAATKIECSNPSDDFTLTAGQIQVAADRDLVRIPMNKPTGLTVEDAPRIGAAAAAYGDSGGKDVVTKLDGRILGVGPTELEVSAQFIPGNSGGPIITGSGGVVAVATYVARESGIPDWIKSGTRFKGTRRFGVRVSDNIQWTPMPLTLFETQSAKISQTDDLIDELIAISRELIYSPFRQPLETKFGDIQELANYISSYNNTCREFDQMSGRRVTKDELEQANGKFRGRIQQSAADLSRAIDSIQSDLSFESQDITAPYLRSRMSDSLDTMHQLSDFIAQNIQDTTSQALFKFKK